MNEGPEFLQIRKTPEPVKDQSPTVKPTKLMIQINATKDNITSANRYTSKDDEILSQMQRKMHSS